MSNFIALLAGILTIIGVIYAIGKDFWPFYKRRKSLVATTERIRKDKLALLINPTFLPISKI
jgi:hypothetical protein